MNCRHQIACLALATCWLLAGGCQNTIKVKVERVMGVSSLSRNSHMGRQLDDTVDNLTRIIESCRDARAAAQRFIQQFPEDVYPPGSAPTQASVSRQLESYQAALNDIETNARLRRTECEAYFVGSEGPPPDPRATLARVRDFCETARADLRDWPLLLKNMPVVAALEAELPTDVPVVRTQKAAVEASDVIIDNVTVTLLAAKRGFGGFVATDVYPINPSDPAYELVLGRSRLSSQPLTQVSVGASGDSAVMLVMEHPGQVRVYQVSNDPAQLTRNIGLLINKATNAAAKYMSAGVAPSTP